MSIQKLHYENLGGMLIRREGFLNWRCPLCKAEGQSSEVMRTCPECGSKEATLPGAQPAPSVPDHKTIRDLLNESGLCAYDREGDLAFMVAVTKFAALAAAQEAKP